MKKLLVILLLLFPFHGAWAVDHNEVKEIESFFGYKFGMSYDDISKENIILTKVKIYF